MSTRRFPIDWPLVIVALLLSVYGISIVYSAGQTDIPTAVARLWRLQAIWFAISLGAAYAVSRFSVRMLDWLTWPAYGLTILLLLALLFVGKGAGTAASTKSWLAIGSVRIGQPSELAKITVVLALAKVRSGFKEPPRSLLELWKPALVVGVPWALIMKQPDLGTGIVFIGFAFAMLFWAGVSWPLLVLVASPVVSLILAYNTKLWGAWFLLLIALVLWYKPYMYEGIFLVVVNVIFGVVSPIVCEMLAPDQQ
jgi:rod shape determining protein RodA